MGTRSTVKFYEQQELILAVYQQFDGYISGVGHDLANFLLKKKIINGITGSESLETNSANGIGCLSAQYVKENKTRVGGFYLTSPHDEQEYNYKVRYNNGKFNIQVGDFNGTPEELLKNDL